MIEAETLSQTNKRIPGKKHLTLRQHAFQIIEKWEIVVFCVGIQPNNYLLKNHKGYGE
ncbi:hypothetical protein [Dyadobacter sp. CY312]|uniref:hypothetical protein n=1 Tax=Dyadobacter sp. CY312 TaxID=2907303 RepID=UPI001F31E767|nr:hypothetical protein [Dyadobacter sp. CY312]MCE7042535.1 hypothetical protein [Dyadobacter sp. CY312]